jgi:hypothetical protein
MNGRTIFATPTAGDSVLAEVVDRLVSAYRPECSTFSVPSPEGTLDRTAALRAAPRDWARKNVQVVVQIKVADGTPSPPHILAAHFW